LVLLALAEPENPNDAQRARFQAKSASAKLSEDDREAFLRILGTLQKQLDALNAQASQILARNPIPLPGTPDYQSLVDLSKQREPVFVEAMSAVTARLSAEGYAKLQTYIQNAKRRMKYLPDSTPMPRQ
jgi:predicted lipoprotein